MCMVWPRASANHVFPFAPAQMGFDVFNALDLMDNKEFLEKLKFGIGDGNLQYYLYNWRCPAMQPSQVRPVRSTRPTRV